MVSPCEITTRIYAVTLQLVFTGHEAVCFVPHIPFLTHVRRDDCILSINKEAEVQAVQKSYLQ